MISITDLLSSFRGVNLAGLVIVVGVAAAFVAGGIVKGILGVGLPLVMVPALSLVMPAPQAISLLAIPVLAANLWQAIDSGVAIGSLRRFFPLLAALVGATLVTVPLALAMPSGMLTLMVALAVLLAALSMAFRPQFDIPAHRQRLAGVAVGALAGVVGGVSSLTGPVVIAYLSALKLEREDFIGCISVIYLFSAIPLYASLAAHGRLGASELAVSLVGLLPMACGLLIGKWLRGFFSELWFRRTILAFLAVSAAALLLQATELTHAPPSANFKFWNK
ncbi:sulfite exporter TauE/SafE family protein [Massilia sp. WG5]|nr:sulfite exporter TauE/SafE family protein [Massilia sp. WG5]ALK99975.1 hypothetical protein AM586_27420 [Massilia sp. WG5]